MNAAPAVYSLSPRADQLLAGVIVLVLLALAGWEVVRFIERSPPSLDAGPTAVTTAQPAASDRPPNLADYQLFGSRTETAVAMPQVLANQAGDTELSLRGTVAGEQPQQGRALIFIKGDGEYVFSAGAELPGNRLLKEVHARHVVIERNASLSLLALPEDGETSQRPRGQTARSGSPPSNQGQRPASLIDQVAMGRVSSMARPNFDASQVATSVRPIAVRENGALVGFKLQPGRDSQLLQQLGLNSRDVLLSIDGVSLSNPAASFQVVQRLQNGSGPVQVRIERDGREQTITVDPSKINL